MGESSPEMARTQGDYRNITGLEQMAASQNTATIVREGFEKRMDRNTNSTAYE